MENTTNERVSIQIERPSLRVFSQADIDAGRTGERTRERDKEADNGQG